jgi:prepilin-type N-terminal cleavage/methylation domain-containing protein
MKKKIIQKSGFTLLEVSIVIALIAILSSLLLVNLQPSRTQEQVNAAQDEIASAVKLAQSFALQGRIQSGAVPKCYGVEKSGADGYRIYYNSLVGCSDSATLVEQHNFSNGVLVTGFNFKFDVPHGKVVSGGSGVAEVSKGGFKKKVTLDGGGAITKD